MAPKFTYIHSDAQMTRNVRELQAYAKAIWIASPELRAPDYSATPAEAIKRAGEVVARDDDREFDNTRWFLFMPMRLPVTVMLSIDTQPDGPVWHLSMSTPNVQAMTAGRTPDVLAKRVLRAFFGSLANVIEGPPEGPFKNVRHFRTPYQADTIN